MKVELGAMTPKLTAQIPGLPEEFDRDADAISRLYLRGMLTQKETEMARKRLLKKMQKGMRG